MRLGGKRGRAVDGGLSGSGGFVLTAATSSEPDDGLGDGDTVGDIQGFAIGTADAAGQLRAERSGKGTGRALRAQRGRRPPGAARLLA